MDQNILGLAADTAHATKVEEEASIELHQAEEHPTHHHLHHAPALGKESGACGGRQCHS
jgi:hypothetical protein